ncbi:uncharacterized protein EV420DRAFT_1694723 [Desarmillaria tabescens]|uniref:DUF6593 domain-containing protein n=1 Tax=Armillaria tabescens TaxID=1929756 RepID=A0AA39K8P6_ARMTA|nr:uncharacterized protein EV420DRAFT_1694723 [Desarmillaria tabescens]KAK0455289.1 hypothetical protein EV420DRAFT_1694723 [Desarmillaria tabescens]
MDSVLTLVNPSPTTHLEFDRNSVVNATLLKNSQPAYCIQTKQRTTSARTDIIDIRTQEVIASIELKEISRTCVKIGKWMKEEHLPDKTCGTFKDDYSFGFDLRDRRVRVIETAYGRYLWKLHVVHRLALYAENNLETPVAFLQPATRTSPLVLVVESEAMGFIDQIIASFIIREKELRAEEKKSEVAAGMLIVEANPLSTGGPIV